MTKLILSKDGKILQQLLITKERVTIGRRPENDIVIDHKAVSGVHAAIITIVNDVFLEDLNSTNGTWVNGNAVKKHFLQNGDVIELGKYQLQFSSDNASHARIVGRLERTGSYPAYGFAEAPLVQAETKPVTPAPSPSEAPPAPSAESAEPLELAEAVADINPISRPMQEVVQNIAPLNQGVLQVLNGPRLGKEIHLNKSITTLGTPKIQVIAISRRPQGYFLTHVEGEQKPIVNGAEIGAAAHALQENDVIELAGTKLMFFYAH
ncbi:MAG: FHA domain-containing protein [Burkholderiaceae bacterium]|nr:MAG: FHA domain-containing protein [Burkholderiaceae bacterium]